MNPPQKGGKRPGAGRPKSLPLGAKLWRVLVTDQERAAIKEFLRRLRRG